jgi:hypothetical protein
MSETQPLILLIDGNNLAHHIYYDLLPGHKVTPVITQRLVGHLSGYAQQYTHQIQVELILDRPHTPDTIPPPGLHLISAEYPQKADDVLIDRFWFHHLSGNQNLVITNDADILEEVTQAGGLWLRVYDFVRRPGIEKPVFREPQEPLPERTPTPHPSKPDPAHSLRSSIYFRIVETQHRQAPFQTAEKQPAPDSTRPMQLAQNETEPDFFDEELDQESAFESLPYSFEASIADEPSQEDLLFQEPLYFLELDNWPLVEGARFLVRSFCPTHQAEFQDMLQSLDMQNIKPADIRALAELLLISCSLEPGFSTRGALMNRVRLALLKAKGEWLTLSSLSAAIGLPAVGLHGKIKKKAAPWLSILQPDNG